MLKSILPMAKIASPGYKPQQGDFILQKGYRIKGWMDENRNPVSEDTLIRQTMILTPLIEKDDTTQTPEAPKVTPENPKTEPEAPKVTPEKPKTETEAPKVTPEKPKAEPDAPMVTPEKPKAEPNAPKVTPEKPRMDQEAPKKSQHSSQFPGQATNGSQSNATSRPATVTPAWKKATLPNTGEERNVLAWLGGILAAILVAILALKPKNSKH